MNTHRTRGGTAAGWRLMLAAMLTGALLVVAGCASSESHPNRGESRSTGPIPGDDGIYAYDGDHLARLDGDPKWERKTWDQRSNLASGTVLLVRSPAIGRLAQPAGAVRLRKVAWVRSEISDAGRVTPIPGSKWHSVPFADLEVPVDFTSDRDSHPDVIEVRPTQPLQPGLYSLYLDAGEASRRARFGVKWPSVDKTAYAAGVCLDHYTGSNAGYKPCAAQSAKSGRDKLQIYLVHPQTAGRSVVISGVIVNNSAHAQRVPILTARLRGIDGSVLARWQFRASRSVLKPGRSTSFRSVVSDAPQQTRSVNVNFNNALGSS